MLSFYHRYQKLRDLTTRNKRGILGTADRFLSTPFFIMEASMQVYLYGSHHNLPYRDSPDRCSGIFHPRDFTGKYIHQGISETPIEETDIWPVLMGLHQLDLPFLTHISAFMNMNLQISQNKSSSFLTFAARHWIEITTSHLPTPQTGSFETEILGMNFCLVTLWNNNDGSHSPFHLLHRGLQNSPEIKKPQFWSDFFHEELKAIKVKADLEVKKAADFAKLLSAL
jgi:hypothetical protein